VIKAISFLVALAVFLAAGPSYATVTCSSDDGNETCECATKCAKSKNQCWCENSLGKKAQSYSKKIEESK
jgi:hypothetical protein